MSRTKSDTTNIASADTASKADISALNIPAHVGIILDGNRRWAKKQGLPSLAGHRRGFSNVKTIADSAFRSGVKILTVFAFSTENWQRENKEVNYLMGLLKLLVTKEAKTLVKKGIKINFFGRLTDFSGTLRSEMKRLEERTKNGLKGTLNICVSYGGRDEIVRAIKKIVRQKISAKEISEELVSANLDSAGLPDPDLIIRTSGEERLSGFLTWQAVYSELYFTPKYWPDFTPADLILALKSYSGRQRRFGAS
jgi:undecaprenyl diphosphate synthase